MFVCHTDLSVPGSVVVTCWENADLLALLYAVLGEQGTNTIWGTGSADRMASRMQPIIFPPPIGVRKRKIIRARREADENINYRNKPN